MQYPNIPKGTRDFSFNEISRRNYIIETIRKKFEIFGFNPIETTSIEYMSTLIDKYGEEGDYLMFKLLHSGNSLKKGISDFMKKIIENLKFKKKQVNFTTLLTEHISNKALRYDLTVPLIRYVAMHRNTIIFPFKRYQIQPVWRAERPQKGRFREFYQCDADIIGHNYLSLWQEIELIQLCDDIFTKLNIPIVISINHRDILRGLVEISGIKKDLWKDFTTSLDKWNKIGKDSVRKEMIRKGISSKSFDKVAFFFDMKENFYKKEKYLTTAFKNSEEGKKGIKDIRFIFNIINNLSLQRTQLEWNISLARGMNYYTGTILEIFPYNNRKENSIGGGGRYDLSNFFGMNNTYGVGISFGLDRIYLVMERENLFKNIYNTSSKVLFINFGDEESSYAYKMINSLRKEGISTQLYPNPIKIGAQFKYASDNHIPFAISVGKDEIKKNKIKVKNIKKRTEKEYDNLKKVIESIKKLN
ncbi:histidine--tRNA ligase [Blattabacterium cuenoti]|uniref:histidine--tRNA ligase n=1 Tax=Blattabacterium cuenoti TaxID=1653831 RepID=UPI00163C5AA2|nr:histidine--tRNA ligase [Blattabacterium cuenoti]